MTRREEDSVIQDVMELLADDGFNALGEALRLIVNQAMRLERQQYWGVEPWERSNARNVYANGYKPKTAQTRVGALDLDSPQVRDGSIFPSSLEKGLRSEGRHGGAAGHRLGGRLAGYLLQERDHEDAGDGINSR